jgi:hypothetical protein
MSAGPSCAIEEKLPEDEPDDVDVVYDDTGYDCRLQYKHDEHRDEEKEGHDEENVSSQLLPRRTEN